MSRIGKSWIALGLGLLAVNLGAGCSSVPKNLEKPEVSLKSMDIQKASLTDAVVLLNLEVENPNSFDIKVDSLKYGMKVNGQPFASGNLNQDTKVAANSSSVVSVPVRMKYIDLYGRFSDLIKKTDNKYQVSGMLTTGGMNFPFEHSGDVKLPTS